MKTFLGLVLVSVLLRTGASLQCETCIGLNKSCNGPQKTCEYGLDACATVTSESTIAQDKIPIRKKPRMHHLSFSLMLANQTVRQDDAYACTASNWAAPGRVEDDTSRAASSLEFTPTNPKQGGVTVFSVVKGCYSKSHCSSPPPSVDLSQCTINMKVECTNGDASPMASTLLLVLSGLLLMKLLL